jgi:hypothetical protein
MAEKRAQNRLDIIGLAQIKQSESVLPLEAQIVDISYDGMRIYVKERVSGRIEILLCYFGDKSQKQIAETVKGQVSWVKGKGLWYSVGIKFDGLNPQDHNGTLAFLDQYIKIK